MMTCGDCSDPAHASTEPCTGEDMLCKYAPKEAAILCQMPRRAWKPFRVASFCGRRLGALSCKAPCQSCRNGTCPWKAFFIDPAILAAGNRARASSAAPGRQAIYVSWGSSVDPESGEPPNSKQAPLMAGAATGSDRTSGDSSSNRSQKDVYTTLNTNYTEKFHPALRQHIKPTVRPKLANLPYLLARDFGQASAAVHTYMRQIRAYSQGTREDGM